MNAEQAIATTPAREKGRLSGIQAGRGIAALAVVVAHSIGHPLPHVFPQTHFVGRYGVTLFFVISGYIMVVSTGTGSFDPLRFMKNRIYRVVPLYWAATLFTAALTLVLPSVFKATEFNLEHLLRSLFFIPGYAADGTIRPFVKLGWTLNFEMFFYLSFAALAAFGARMRAALLSGFFLFLIACGSLIDFDSPVLEFFTKIDTLGFVAGVWLAVETRRRAAPSTRVLAIAGVISLVIALGILIPYPLVRDNPWTQVLLVIACTAQVGVLAETQRLGWTIPRPLEIAGDASYSIYLFHMFGVGIGTVLLLKLMSGMIVPAILAGAVLGVTIGTAVYFLLEAPMTRLIRRAVTPKRPAESPIRPLERVDGL